MRGRFAPVLAGATLGDRLLAGAGAAAGIVLAALVTHAALGPAATAALVAPIGASAVLVFAVPASPLAQPWPVIGGNLISALVGVAITRVVPVPFLAAGLAVGLAILAMSLARCLHPPGGAAALLAVIGGPAVAAAGWRFALVPVGADAVLLVLAGLAFHRLSGHAYPHRPSAPDPHPEDLEAALADLGETFDIAPADLAALIARVEDARRRRVAAAARLRQGRREGEG